MGATEHHYDPDSDLIFVAGHWIQRSQGPAEAQQSDGFERAAFAREVADELRQAGRDRDVVSVPTNFLPPHLRTTTTTPAGQSVYEVENPRPSIDAHEARLQAAQVAREIEQRGRLSGSHVRTTTPESWEARPFIRQSATYGGGHVDWAALSEGDDQ